MLRNVQHKLQMEALLQYLCSVTNKICISNNMHPKAPSLHSVHLLVTYTLWLNIRKVMLFSLETQKGESAKNPISLKQSEVSEIFLWMKNVSTLFITTTVMGYCKVFPIFFYTKGARF